MPASSAERVRKHREAMRAEGLKPKQMWVYDTNAPGFAEECRRASQAMAESDRRDPGLKAFMDAALDDLLKATPE